MFKVSVIIPTYNCASILMECLHSIRHQNYPQEMVEIIIVDGFSKDKTRQVAEKFGAVVLDNAFVIHPLGRPIGIRVATGNLILCLDSDNILPEKGWMQKMTAPFRDEEIIAAEPLYYVAEETDNVITKYCSLIGGDDPIVVYLGFHERYSYLAGVWTRVPVREEKKSSHLKVKFLDSSTIPSLGANGFIVRQEILRRVPFDPFYHVDVSHKIIERNDGYWAKVETGVIHRHGDTVKTFILKKKRRIERRLDKKVDMSYSYSIRIIQLAQLVLKALLVFPILLDTARGFARKKSPVWLLHPLIFYSVLGLYTYTFLLRKIVRVKDKGYEKS